MVNLKKELKETGKDRHSLSQKSFLESIRMKKLWLRKDVHCFACNQAYAYVAPVQLLLPTEDFLDDSLIVTQDHMQELKYDLLLHVHSSLSYFHLFYCPICLKLRNIILLNYESVYCELCLSFILPGDSDYIFRENLWESPIGLSD